MREYHIPDDTAAEERECGHHSRRRSARETGSNVQPNIDHPHGGRSGGRPGYCRLCYKDVDALDQELGGMGVGEFKGGLREE